MNPPLKFHYRHFCQKSKTSLTYFKRSFKYPIKYLLTWYTIPFYILFSLFAYKRYHHRYSSQPKVAKNWQVYLYSLLPWRLMSRTWGYLNTFNMPYFIRLPSLNLYIWYYDVDLREAQLEDIYAYKNLSELFNRKLKPITRPLDSSILLSPADGQILHYGVVNDDDYIEQVKGIDYSLPHFLGFNSSSILHNCLIKNSSFQSILSSTKEEGHTQNKTSCISYERSLSKPSSYPDGFCLKSVSERNHFPQIKENSLTSCKNGSNLQVKLSKKLCLSPKNTLYYVTIYLAPGDYHGFHSPSKWIVAHRRHFPGELFSVSPAVAHKIKGLFNHNERVVFTGVWKFGYFSMTAVGATNVGSIKSCFDEELLTNAPNFERGVYFDKYIHNALKSIGITVQPGDYFGEFNLGSSIVVIFEAPLNFAFNIQPLQKIKVGQSLGELL